LYTEKGWQNGWQQAMQDAKVFSSQYKRIIISSRTGPALLYYISWNQYSPELFQKDVKDKVVDLAGFGDSRIIDNIYFPIYLRDYNLYNVSSVLDKDTLYVVPFEEIKLDLVKEPKRLPLDVSLVKTVTYLSGEPAFYFLTRK